MEKQQQAYLKVEQAFLVPTSAADHWLNHEDYDFYTAKKDGKIIIIVEEKVKEN